MDALNSLESPQTPLYQFKNTGIQALSVAQIIKEIGHETTRSLLPAKDFLSPIRDWLLFPSAALILLLDIPDAW